MVLNRIIGIVAFALSACLFVVSNSAAALGLVLCTLFIPLASLLIGHVAARRTEISFDHKESTVAGSDMELRISVSRPAFFRGGIDLAFVRENALTGAVERMPVSLAPAMGRPERFSLPLSAACCGKISISLASCQVKDVFGFYKMPLAHASYASSYCVYPPVSDLAVQTAHADRATSSGATYDPHRHGQDPTEVFETREYRDGDSMKAVHWKLSARFDDLMVREPSRPTDYDVMVVAYARNANATEVLNATLSLAASVSLAFVREGVCHTFARVGKTGALDVSVVDGREAFEEALEGLVSAPMPGRGGIDVELAGAYFAAHGVTKVVLVTDGDDETLFESVSAFVDLSVFHIGAKGAAGLGGASGYRLAHLPAEDVATRVKCLEL